VEQEVGGSSPPNCTTQNQALSARKEPKCFPAYCFSEAPGKGEGFFLWIRQAIALPTFAAALLMVFLGVLGVLFWPALSTRFRKRRLGSSNFTGSIHVSAYAEPIYTTVTDDRIEAPAPEKDKVTQS
jgi:hypothetical protein